MDVHLEQRPVLSKPLRCNVFVQELFGPLSMRALEEDQYIRQIEGYLPDATVAFIDEVFKANSAILNTLLTILNERLFDNGSVRSPVPLLCLVSPFASTLPCPLTPPSPYLATPILPLALHKSCPPLGPQLTQLRVRKDALTSIQPLHGFVQAVNPPSSWGPERGSRGGGGGGGDPHTQYTSTVVQISPDDSDGPGVTLAIESGLQGAVRPLLQHTFAWSAWGMPGLPSDSLLAGHLSWRFPQSLAT